MLFKSLSILVLMCLVSLVMFLSINQPVTSVTVIVAFWLGAVVFWLGGLVSCGLRSSFKRVVTNRSKGTSSCAASGSGSGSSAGSCSGAVSLLYVGNLDYSATEDEVRQLFNAFGKVVSVRMMYDPRTKRFRGYCFVEMAERDLQKALTVSGQDFKGRKLKVNLAKDKRQ